MTTSPVMGITEELLAELEEKAKAATRGPWHKGTDLRQIEAGNGTIVCHVSGSSFNGSVQDDAIFIAAANPATLLALIVHVRSLEARLAYIERNFIGVQFDYDCGERISVMAIHIGDYVPVCRSAASTIDAAIAQEGQSHE